MMAAVFRSVGADWNQFRAMLQVSIRMDFRGFSGRRSGKRLAPIFRSLFFYGFMGLFLSTTLAGKVPLFIYSLLILTYSMFMMAFAVILEFGNSIVHPDDGDILGHRPVTSRTYFLARLANLLFYITVLSGALCLFPALIGLRVAGAPAFFPPVFFLMALAANLVAASLVVLIYTGMLRLMSYERFKDTVAYLQMVFSLVLFFLYQWLPRWSRESLVMGGDFSSPWLLAAPPAWFAGAVQVLLGRSRPGDTRLALAALGVSLILVCLAFRRISVQYTMLVSRQLAVSRESSPPKGEKTLKRAIPSGSGFWEWIIPWYEARAAYYGVLRMIRRDRSVKMGIYPLWGMPLAVVLLALIQGDLTDPFVSGPFSERGSLAGTLNFFIFFMSYFFLRGLTYSRHWKAAWIFHVAPLKSPGRFYQGVKLVVFIRLISPFYLLVALLYATQIPPAHALKHTLSLFILCLVASSIVSTRLREYPFSRRRERGEQSRRFAFFWVVFPFFILASFIQTYAYRSGVIWWLVHAGLLILFIVLEIVSVKILDRRLKRSAFSG
jgi:hypothetical protein